MRHVYVKDGDALQVKVYLLPGGGALQTFWEARTLPLPNNSQRQGVQVSRWAKSLGLSDVYISQHVQRSATAIAKRRRLSALAAPDAPGPMLDAGLAAAPPQAAAGLAAAPLQEGAGLAAAPPQAGAGMAAAPPRAEAGLVAAPHPALAGGDAAAGAPGPGVPELAISTELALLLLARSASRANGGAQENAAKVLAAVLRLCLPDEPMEIALRVGQGDGAVSFGIPLHNGGLDCRAVLLAGEQNGARKLWRQLLKRLRADTQQLGLAELIHQSLLAGAPLCQALCAAVAPAVDATVAALAGKDELLADPLRAGVEAIRGRKTLRRLDPAIRDAIADVGAAGPAALALMQRARSGLFERFKKARTQFAVDRKLAAYQAVARARAQAGPPRVALAFDASRVGQDKTLVTACWLPDAQLAFWLPPQVGPLAFPGHGLWCRRRQTHSRLTNWQDPVARAKMTCLPSPGKQRRSHRTQT